MTRGGDSKDAERDTRNQGLKEEERQLHDPDERTPHGAEDDDVPAPKRPGTPAEDSDDIAHLENPPQSDGPRERSNDSV